MKDCVKPTEGAGGGADEAWLVLTSERNGDRAPVKNSEPEGKSHPWEKLGGGGLAGIGRRRGEYLCKN